MPALPDDAAKSVRDAVERSPDYLRRNAVLHSCGTRVSIVVSYTLSAYSDRLERYGQCCGRVAS